MGIDIKDLEREYNLYREKEKEILLDINFAIEKMHNAINRIEIVAGLSIGSREEGFLFEIRKKLKAECKELTSMEERISAEMRLVESYLMNSISERNITACMPGDFTIESFSIERGLRLDKYNGVIGLLFADYSNIPVREYITEDMLLYDSQSADYIYFVLPGYSNKPSTNCSKVDDVVLNGKQLYFDSEEFAKYVKEYRKRFGLDYLDKPILVLHEYKDGTLSSRRIILELEYKEIKKLFNNIITVAKEHTDLSAFSSELQKKYIFDTFPKLLKMLISTFAVDIDEVKTSTEGVFRFRIKDK